MNSSQSETFCDGWYLRNKLDLQSFGDAFSLRSSWSEKYCWFVYCIPVPILIKLQISLYILLEISSYTVICLRSWLRTPLCLEHDSLGVKISFFTPWPWRLRNPIPTSEESNSNYRWPGWQWAEECPLPDLIVAQKPQPPLRAVGNGTKTCHPEWYKIQFSPLFDNLGKLCTGPLIRSRVSSIPGSVGRIVQPQPSPLTSSARTSLLLGELLSWSPLPLEILRLH